MRRRAGRGSSGSGRLLVANTMNHASASLLRRWERTRDDPFICARDQLVLLDKKRGTHSGDVGLSFGAVTGLVMEIDGDWDEAPRRGGYCTSLDILGFYKRYKFKEILPTTDPLLISSRIGYWRISKTSRTNSLRADRSINESMPSAFSPKQSRTVLLSIPWYKR